MDRRIFAIFLSACLPWLIPAANATIISFEDVATTGGIEPVTASSPYTESGYTLTPETSAFIVDSAFPIQMYGNNTDWYSVHTSARSTLTSDLGSFDLLSVLVGPTTVSESLPIDMSIVGTLSDGTTLSQHLTNLVSATTATLNWNDLSSVTFFSFYETGIDDIDVQNVSLVSEPNVPLLLGLGLILLGYKRKLSTWV
jgi:hypothetical protein